VRAESTKRKTKQKEREARKDKVFSVTHIYMHNMHLSYITTFMTVIKKPTIHPLIAKYT